MDIKMALLFFPPWPSKPFIFFPSPCLGNNLLRSFCFLNIFKYFRNNFSSANDQIVFTGLTQKRKTVINSVSNLKTHKLKGLEINQKQGENEGISVLKNGNCTRSDPLSYGLFPEDPPQFR